MTFTIESILDDFCDLEEHRVLYRSQKKKIMTLLLMTDTTNGKYLCFN